MVEAVFHRAQHGGSVRGALPGSTRAMARPVFYSVLIIILVYVPILTLGGVEERCSGPWPRPWCWR
ncbi:MAG: hypothetical protein M5U28_01605 [Sandaracinaceae bacterium]|nr:hypothetical protein [Sandaracinaceae bacterium]